MNCPRYTVTSRPPSVDDLAALYADAGFAKGVERCKLQRLIDGASRWWIATGGASGQTLGIGRCQTDWARYACIYDVIVRSAHRREGIGSAIVGAILRDLTEAGVDIVHLWPTKGNVRFYEKLGFRALSNEQPVMRYEP